MDFFTAATSMTATKKYEKRDVDDKLIGVMLFMANQADSAGNLQGWEFIVVKDEETKKRLHKAALNVDIVKSAPVLIVVCADLKKFSIKYEERGEYVYSLQDTAGAITMMRLTAEILGLGTAWIRAFDEQDIKMTLGLPNEMRPVGIITVGFPLERAERRGLKPFEHMTSLDMFKKKYDVSYMFQTGPKEEVFKPILNQIIDKMKKKK